MPLNACNAWVAGRLECYLGSDRIHATPTLGPRPSALLLCLSSSAALCGLCPLASGLQPGPWPAVSEIYITACLAQRRTPGVQSPSLGSANLL